MKHRDKKAKKKNPNMGHYKINCTCIITCHVSEAEEQLEGTETKETVNSKTLQSN